jgi:hypothetical protein
MTASVPPPTRGRTSRDESSSEPSRVRTICRPSPGVVRSNWRLSRRPPPPGRATWCGGENAHHRSSPARKRAPARCAPARWHQARRRQRRAGAEAAVAAHLARDPRSRRRRSPAGRRPPRSTSRIPQSDSCTKAIHPPHAPRERPAGSGTPVPVPQQRRPSALFLTRWWISRTSRLARGPGRGGGR